MKRRERDKAILLRQQGQSLNDIAARLRVAKATVSLWVRDIKLTQAQRNSLTKRGFSMDAIEKRRI
ncbi:MAG: helix-turn-helix domain-containing protein, partial [Patescibacteria group bacterium]